MEPNLLVALNNLSELRELSLQESHMHRIRINNVGVALEYFVKDAFCGSFGKSSMVEKDEEHRRSFSYLGSQNHPPDFIIRGGDAVEVKKIEREGSPLALNSSFPKAYLYSDDPRITAECRGCESDLGGWEVKDSLYVIGVVTGDDLKTLWVLYGNCFAADREKYQLAASSLSASLESAQGIELGETTELGRVNGVDPLGITSLRVRGMWFVENPSRVFEDLIPEDSREGVKIYALMKKEKFDALVENTDSGVVEKLRSRFTITDCDIKNPDNPANTMKATFITGVVG